MPGNTHVFPHSWISISELGPQQRKYVENRLRAVKPQAIEAVHTLWSPVDKYEPRLYVRPTWFYDLFGLTPPIVAKVKYRDEEYVLISMTGTSLELLNFCPILQLQVMYEQGHIRETLSIAPGQKFTVTQWFLFNTLVRFQVTYQFQFYRRCKGNEVKLKQLVRQQIDQLVEKFVGKMYYGFPLLTYLRTEQQGIQEQFEHWLETSMMSVVRPFGHVPVYQETQPPAVQFRATVETMQGPLNVWVHVDTKFSGVLVDFEHERIHEVVGDSLRCYIDKQLVYVSQLRQTPLEGSLVLNNQHMSQLIVSQFQTRPFHESQYLKSLLVYFPTENQLRHITIHVYNRFFLLKSLVRQIYWLTEQLVMNRSGVRQVTHFQNCNLCPIKHMCETARYSEKEGVGDFEALQIRKQLPERSAEDSDEELSGHGDGA